MNIEDLLNTLLMNMEDVKTASDEMFISNHYCTNKNDLIQSLELLNKALEKSVITSRNTLETLRPYAEYADKKEALSYIDVIGATRIVNYKWLHIKLNTLLPHCRFQTPAYLSDTVSRLLDNYRIKYEYLPYYQNAMLIIDEHSNLSNRNVYDQDNKGWKAISNAMKGRLFPDDDQFTLSLALLSKTSYSQQSTNIFVIDSSDAEYFFNMWFEGSLYW